MIKKLKPILILIVVIAIAFAGFKIVKSTLKIAFNTALKIKKELKAPKRYNAAQEIAVLKSPTITDDLKIFTASSLDRIFQDGKTLVLPSFATEAKISAANHEYESFQIVIYPFNKPLNGITIISSDLTNSSNRSILDKSNIKISKLGYIPTQQPYYPVRYIGPWPDPLMPFSRGSVEAGKLQPFWVSVYVPIDTKPGNYQGQITVNADGIQPQIIPISLRVYNFTLPKSSHLKTAFDFYPYLLKYRYFQKEKEGDVAYQGRINNLNEEFIQMMLKYRQNPILNIDPMSQEDLGRVDRYLALGLNNFSIGRKGGTFDNNWPKDDESIENLLGLYQTYGEVLKLNQMLEYTYIYTWDEGDLGNPTVAKVSSMIHRAYPGLKNMVCYHGLWDPDEHPQWGKDIDIWTFQIDDFNETKTRRLQKMGMEMWMYISGPSGTGSPNLAMDFDSIGYRMVSWLCWKYDIKGFLYWCVNYWPLVDPFENTKNTKWEQNNNGLLFYPGENGPIPSLRVEVFRDGMEDYEYIQTLFNNLKLLKEKGFDKTHPQLFTESIRLLTVDDLIAKGMDQYTQQQDVLLKRRNSIAEKIEESNQLLSVQ